ncbi:DUF2264 domain-containing protein [Granulicella arctica]|uniref:DUF2264 domain-containing protein n=1 Tax=Granulicella arctica TaxID=940613 RepID=A0A7Y9PIC0_9BACT|nr:DUF2264 domain-containing protein [Granulicella arctica]NYF80280.1 hypothetical protein [Granulicella arctica]
MMGALEGPNRRRFLLGSVAAGAATVLTSDSVAAAESAQATALDDRKHWLQQVQLVSEPVLKALNERSLRRTMPVEAAVGQEASRAIGTHLEALGRLLAGLAPWLELEPENEDPVETSLRNRYRDWARAGIASAVDPASPDHMRFGDSSQTLVDSSFLALALLRAPKQLLHALDAKTQTLLVEALLKERTILPGFNNWLLFAAINEAALKLMGQSWDRMRVDYALREHASWYLGDGTYGDGPHFHWDFYNSFVIQPYLLQLMDTLGAEIPTWAAEREAIHQRARRYAAVQERLINPDGSYPVLGRSTTYRCGAFHLLADVSRRRMLPDDVTPAQVRCALTAVMQRTLGAQGTFSADGWLQIGLAGHQPSLGEAYISTGSLYLCSAAWLPLGLPPTDPFWSAPPARWTSQKIWSGEDAHADHARDD